MKGIRVTSDGHSVTTKIRDAETGEIIRCTDIVLSCSAQGAWSATITVPVEGIDVLVGQDNVHTINSVYGADEVPKNVV